MKRITIVIILIALISPFVHAQPENPNANSKYPFDLDVLNEFSYEIAKNDNIIPIAQDNKFCYIDANTKEKITDKLFDEAYPFKGKYALVKENGKYGIINRRGAYLIKPIYSEFQSNDAKLYADEDGLVFDNQYQYFSFSSGKFVPEGMDVDVEGKPVQPKLWPFKEGKKYGFIIDGDKIAVAKDANATESGIENKKVKPQFDSILCLCSNYAVLKKGKKIGIINKSGQIYLKFEFLDYVGNNGKTGDYYQFENMFALKKNNIWYYYNGLKKMFESDKEPISVNDNVIIFKTDGLYNYMDNSGNVVLKKNYKWIAPSGYVAINEKNELVLFNKNKEEFVYYKN